MKLENLYKTVYDWVLNYGPKLIIGLLILLIGLWLIKFIKERIFFRIQNKYFDSPSVSVLLALITLLLYVLLIFAVAYVVGFQFSILTGILGALGVAAGLTLSGALQNMANFFLITLLRPFEIGDHIIAQGLSGRVSVIHLFYTAIITSDNKKVFIPNGKLFNEVILNVSPEGRLPLDIEIKLGYVADVEKVKNLILEAIKSTETILSDSRNIAGVSGLEIDGVRFIINVWVNTPNYLTAKLALQEKILANLVAAGIKLPGT